MMTQPEFVQIQADKAEISRRIKAFCDRKRQDINEMNIKLYCGGDPKLLHQNDCEGYSCARIDAVYVPRMKRSRYKISSVHNKDGPQTTSENSEIAHSVPTSCADNSKGVDLESRLATLESHCKVDSCNKTDSPLVARIKALEDRILYLEGVSLEYFNPSLQSNYKSDLHPAVKELPAKSEPKSQPTVTDSTSNYDLSLDEIDEKIRKLKEKLKTKL